MDEGYWERKDAVVKWKKWGSGGNDDRPVKSTTVSENSTIDTKRERIRIFRAMEADAFDSIPPVCSPPAFVSPVSHPPLSFEEIRRAKDSDRKATIRRFEMFETLWVTESFGLCKTSLEVTVAIKYIKKFFQFIYLTYYLSTFASVK